MNFLKVLLTVTLSVLFVANKTFCWNESMNDNDKKYLNLYGWFISEQLNLKEFDFSQEQFEALFEGINMSIQGKPTPITDPKDVDSMQVFLNKKNNEYRQKRDKINTEISQINKVKMEEFVGKLDKNPEVKKTETGLRFIVKSQGNTNKPDDTDAVLVHYVGTLIDGSEFDSSVRRGTPAQFRLDQVVAGFSEGLQQIGENGEATLYIPAELGYGNHDVAGIPPGSMIIFDVKLLKVLKNHEDDPKKLFE